jgi:hypothetical protein
MTAGACRAGVVLKSGESIAADMVVDCSGRSSGMIGWLQAAGYEAPPVQEISAGIAYGSRTYAMPPGWFQQHVRPLSPEGLPLPCLRITLLDLCAVRCK